MPIAISIEHLETENQKRINDHFRTAELISQAVILKGHRSVDIQDDGIYIACNNGAYRLNDKCEVDFWDYIFSVKTPTYSDKDDNYIADSDLVAFAEAHRSDWIKIYDSEGALIEEKTECTQCKVSLNKDGSCPSCEADHAQKAYEDEQAGIAEAAMAEQAAAEAGQYEATREGIEDR
jgi:hypothetical protein